MRFIQPGIRFRFSRVNVSRAQPTEPSVASAAAPGRARVVVVASVLLAAVALAYHGTFAVPFVFDDIVAIVENPAVRDPSLHAVFGGGQPGGLTTSGRPVVTLTLALNHAWSGRAVWSYHLVNLLGHAAAGLCLFGIVRRTLQRPALRAKFGGVALPVAGATAAIWLLHPLQTESVTYVVQRAESLGGLFYLLTLYAFIRSVVPGAAGLWRAVAGLACLLGMGSKEVVVSAPLLVLLYDRTFVSGTFRAAWQHHRGTYLLLGATWSALLVLVLGTGGRGGTAGFDAGISSWTYALTQCGAIVRYLALSAWPGSLVFDYGTGVERQLADVLPQAGLVVTLVVAVGFAVVRWPGAGFLGCGLLATLAPSSSVVPVATQTIAEHRMYLPLAALAVAGVLGAYRTIGFKAVAAAGAAAAGLLLATIARNHTYRSDEVLWRDTANKHPVNARAHNNLGQAVFRAGRIAESIGCYERALRLQPDYPESHYNLGVALAALERWPEAISHYETALRLRPAYPEALNNLGNALDRTGRREEAVRRYEQALAVKPDFGPAHNNLGRARLAAGRGADAEKHFQRAREIEPGDAEASYNLGNARAAAGAMREALELYRRAVQAKPDYAEAWVNAGNAALALEQPAEAIAAYERAVALAPGLVEAHFNLGSALMDQGRWADAIPRLEAVLRLKPDHARAPRALGFALAQAGRIAEAVAWYERYLVAAPGDAEAAAELRQLRGRR